MSATPPEDTRDARGIGGGLRGRTARGTIVNGLYTVAINFLGLVKGLVVAALLAPSEFGIWGILTLALLTVLWVRYVGVSDRYVQQDEDDQESAFRKGFTLELIFMGVCFVLMIVVVLVLALLYGRSDLVAPGLVLALVLPLGALQFPMWAFYRRMDFVKQRLLQAVDPVLSFVVTIALAAAGLSYWSLVIGVVVGALAAAAAAVWVSPYRLGLEYEPGTARGYVVFSWPLVVAGLAGIGIGQGAYLLGQAELGIAAVGALSLALSIAMYADKVDGMISDTIYPAICAVKERQELMFEAFIKSNRLAVMWGVPFGVGLTLFAADLVHFGLGERWEPAIGLLQAFGLIAAARQIGFNWHAFFRARADTWPIAVNGLVGFAVFVAVAVPLVAAIGLEGFAWAFGAVELGALAVRTFYLERLFPQFRIFRYLLRAMLPAVPAAGAVLLVRAVESTSRSLPLAIAELALFVGVVAGTTYVFERRLLRESIGYLRRSAAVSSPAGA